VGEAGAEDEGEELCVLIITSGCLPEPHVTPPHRDDAACIISHSTSIMPGTSLPRATSPTVTAWAEYEPNTLSAYSVCLEYEKELATSKDRVRLVRLLGYLLYYAPRRSIRNAVALSIHSRKPESDLTDLGEYFENHVIFACEFRYQIPRIFQIFCLVQLGDTEEELPHRPVTRRGPPLKEREAQ
jgi:hypothetical protein